MSFFTEMFSESSKVSCMRFCTAIVIVAIMGNYTFLNVMSMIKTGTPASMEMADIFSLLGVLGIKAGQKKLEVKK